MDDKGAAMKTAVGINCHLLSLSSDCYRQVDFIRSVCKTVSLARLQLLRCQQEAFSSVLVEECCSVRLDNSRSRGTESERTQRDAVFELGYHAAKDNAQFSVTDSQSVGDIALKEAPKHFDNPSTEVNMEATIDPEDVIRAGGIGARDDISSLLPIASDSTDFEASLLDAREYEEPQGELRRPGLGWMEDRVAE